MKKRRLVTIITGLLLLVACGSQADESLPQGGAAQTIKNKGSDTIVNLALAWAETYSEVRISVTGGGSGTGIAAMINGTVDFANASRNMKPEEVEEAKANGIEPVEHVIAGDAIASAPRLDHREERRCRRADVTVAMGRKRVP